VLAAQPAVVRAADYYAANNGTPTAAGTIGDPWDLQTALNSGAPIGSVQPGDTIWLRGGVYLAPFTSFLKGTPPQPVIVRNYDNERVILDNSFAQCDPLYCPPQEWLDANPSLPCAPHNLQCNSFLSITEPCDPSENPACTPPFNARPSSLVIPKTSHDVWFWGLEFATLEDSAREYIEPSCTPANPAGGCCYVNGVQLDSCSAFNPFIPRAAVENIVWRGDRIKVINAVFRDGSNGIPWFTEPIDGEVYGSLSFNNGWASALRGHGHGSYNENSDCLDRPSERVWRETAFFNNYALGLRINGIGCGPADNIDIEGVVSFSTGGPARAFYATQDPLVFNPGSYVEERKESLLMSSAQSQAHGRVKSTYVYNPINPDPLLLTTLSIPFHAAKYFDLAVEDSVFVGDTGVQLNHSRQIRFAGNTLVGKPGFDFLGSFRLLNDHNAERLPLQHFSGNTYYRTDGGAVKIGYVLPGQGLPFTQWQSVYGKDLDSTAITGMPSTNWVYVRPNAYELGRGHIIIYNWEGLSSVTVDLTPLGLAQGQAFTLHDVQSFDVSPSAGADYYGTVAVSDIFNSGSPTVSVPMTANTVTIPIGSSEPVPSTLPEFGMFVVLPQ
jgi:hypothetical protein